MIGIDGGTDGGIDDDDDNDRPEAGRGGGKPRWLQAVEGGGGGADGFVSGCVMAANHELKKCGVTRYASSFVRSTL